jgi:hypothetical protein
VVGLPHIRVGLPHIRVLRFLPAVLAAYEFRYLIAHLAAFGTAFHGGGSGSPTLWATALVAVGAGSFLRESGRGLASRLPRPTWSLEFAGSWMLCSAVVAGLLAAAGLFHFVSATGHPQPFVNSVMAGAWSALPTVMLVGLLLAASLCGARWLLVKLVRPRKRAGEFRAPPRLLRLVGADRRPAAAPLTAGWSDRGPPRRAALAAF